MSTRDFGGVPGILLGYGIVGGLLGALTKGQKTVMEYGKLSDRRWQGSEYGGDIPRVYGTVGLKGSQVLWLEHNQLKEVVKKKKSGGKGGGSSTTTKTYSYFATFALALCEGEIAGIRRIWCMDKLLYNAGSDDLETIIASNQAAKGWRLYRGTDDQLPDPRMEADIGVGRTPAYRGLAYLVFDDFALADYSNTLQAAQFKVEVMTAISETPEIVQDARHDSVGPRACSNPQSTQPVVFSAPIDGTYLNPLNVTAYSMIGDQPIVLGRSTTPNIDGLPANGSFGYGASDLPSFMVRHGGSSSGTNYLYCELSGSTFKYYSVPMGEFLGYDQVRYVKVGSRLYVGSTLAAEGLFRFDPSSSLLADYQLGARNDNGRTYNWLCLHGDLLYAARASASEIDYFDQDLTYLGTLPTVPGGGAVDWLWSVDSQLVAVKMSRRAYVYDGVAWQLATADCFAGLSISTAIDTLYYSPRDGLCRSYLPLDDPKMRFMTIAFPSSPVLPQLGSIVEREVELSSLASAADVDATLLTDLVRGYRIPGGSIRSVLEPLQGAYPFDVVPSGYKLKFVPRGQTSLVTIPWEDLAAANSDEIGDMLAMPREMDSQLPQRVSITALSSTREYASSTQYYERLNTSAVNVEQRDIPLVLSDDEVAQMAEKLLFLRWLERTDASFSLPATYLNLEPADVVTVEVPYGTFELRLTEVNYEADGRLTCKAKPNNAAIYTSNAAGAVAPGPDGGVPLTGPSLFLALDIPVIDETLQNAAGFVGVMCGYTSGWPGGVAVRSIDSGQTWADLQAFVGSATIGTARIALPASSCTLIDQRAMTVDLISGELESITRDQMLSGQHYAAYGTDGRWEIVRFQNAVLQADGSYLVSGFLRGERGTEWATVLHQVGDFFVLLDDPDNAFIGSAVGSIGVPATYRGVTSGASIDESAEVAFTYQGVNLECLSPVYAKGARDGSGNFSGTFTRRSRLSSSWWSNGVPAPVGEASETYEIDVMSGATVKRTISVTSPSFSYSAANQTTDFGSPQASITFRIFQMSQTVGRGYPLEVTL